MTASAANATRLVLVANGGGEAEGAKPPCRPVRRPDPQLRHYRLARTRVAALRAPKHPHLGRMHD